MGTRKFAIEQAVRIVASMNVDNKQKAVFDFAESILEWLGDVPRQTYKPSSDGTTSAFPWSIQSQTADFSPTISSCGIIYPKMDTLEQTE